MVSKIPKKKKKLVLNKTVLDKRLLGTEKKPTNNSIH